MILDPKNDKNLNAALAYARVEALSASTIQMLSAFKDNKAEYKKSKKSQRLIPSVSIKDIIASKSSNNR